MRTSASPIRLRTEWMLRSNTSPSWRRTTLGLDASGSPAISVVNASLGSMRTPFYSSCPGRHPLPGLRDRQAAHDPAREERLAYPTLRMDPSPRRGKSATAHSIAKVANGEDVSFL